MPARLQNEAQKKPFRSNRTRCRGIALAPALGVVKIFRTFAARPCPISTDGTWRIESHVDRLDGSGSQHARRRSDERRGDCMHDIVQIAEWLKRRDDRVAPAMPRPGLSRAGKRNQQKAKSDENSGAQHTSLESCSCANRAKFCVAPLVRAAPARGRAG